jgi:hypothetical protein
MSHTYLIDLYGLINQRLEEVACEVKMERSTGTTADYLKGRHESLKEFKEFLTAHYDRKLPRRLRGKYSD